MRGDKVRAEVAGIAALVLATTLGAAEYQDDWGPPVGTEMPGIAAADQHGELRGFENLKGEHGLLLFMVRSADW